MILKRLAEGIKSQDWFVVMVEIMIVVVGIFIGLQVDDWNEARKDRATERLYLAELLDDFETKQETLDREMARLEGILTAMNGLMEQSAMDAPTWTVQELNTAFREVQQMPAVTPVSRAFDNMTGSGDLKLLRNRELKNAFAFYFANGDVVDLIQQTHENELVQTFNPYIIENLDYQAVGLEREPGFPHPLPVNEGRILDVLHTEKFRNVVMQKWIISNDLLNEFSEQRDLNQNILQILNAEFNGGAP